MNRTAVCTSLNADPAVACAANELLIVASAGLGANQAVDATHCGPFAPPTTVNFLVGLKDGTSKEVISVNPKSFSYSVLAYAAAVARTVVVGDASSTGKIKVLDPSVASNMFAIGNITVSRVDPTSAVAPSKIYSEPVQIVTGDTTATILAKLNTAATKIVTQLNADYPSNTASLTANAHATNAALTFVFNKDLAFNVVVDGIFDGSTVTVTNGSPIVSGLTGVEVNALERESAILDGYNPTQTNLRQSFNLSNYLNAVAATNYDAILITTKLPKEYESPDAPSGWSVTAVIYSPNVTPGTKGANTAAIEAILAAMKTANP
jgi:hypothetical protein